MRTLEFILVLLLIIHVVLILFRFFDKWGLKNYFIVLPFLLVILHLMLEGYRWQMIPAYFLLFLLLWGVFVKKRPHKYVRILRNIGLLLVLGPAIFLPNVLPVLSFENDNGDYRVGVEKIYVIDEDRPEILTDDPNDVRVIAVRLFYPAENGSAGNTDYIPDFETIKSTYQKKLGWPPVLLEYLKYFEIEAIENAAISSSEKFPLVIYSHGLTNNYTEASGRMMKLASRGYIVAAVNHTYSSDYALFPDGRMVGYKALSILGDPIEKVDSVKTIIANQWVGDTKSVIAQLRQSRYSGSVDFNSIGLLGFSAGGTMATLGSYTIKNVKAAINLDGTPRGINDSLIPKCPQLFMFSEPVYYTDAQIEAWGITREMIDAPLRLIDERSKEVLLDSPGNSYIVRIPGTKHSNFIEYALISPLSNALEIGGSIDSWKCYDMINEMLYSFLDKNLKNKQVDFPEFPENELTKNKT